MTSSLSEVVRLTDFSLVKNRKNMRSTKIKYLILGAGPAGLTFATKLRDLGENDFLVLEQEFTAGGLCRSCSVDGFPFDIGGGHFLDVRIPYVNDFLFRFLPKEEWNSFIRRSCIAIGENFVDHPIEANIWQMDINSQIEYLKSIAVAGCVQGKPLPANFVDWIYWKLGSKIASEYMIPYNNKMFADDLNVLGTYWLEKLPDVNFEEILRSCLEHKAYGKQPAHAEFLYPKKYGYGELWLRMANVLEGRIEYNSSIKKINFDTKTVGTADGRSYTAEKIIVTIPWMGIEEMLGVPEKIRDNIKKLKTNAVETRYYPDNLDTMAHWIYYPDPKLPYHRILVRHNFSPKSKGYWTETRRERVSLVSEVESKYFSYMNNYAYPLNTIEKPGIMSALLAYGEKHAIYGLGRWGEHSHYNSDVVVDLSIRLAEKIVKNGKIY